MEYRFEFADKVSKLLEGSVDNAENINEAYEKIGSYFNDIGDSLKKEIEVLRIIEHTNNDEIIEFTVEDNGLRFEKAVSSISVKRVLDGHNINLAILGCKDNLVVNMENGEECSETLIDSWLRETIDVRLS
jgi:hypothetical protein